jgi:hypothetical protein
MQGKDLKAIRKGLGLTALAFGTDKLGYTGTRASIEVSVYRLEADTRPIPPRVELALIRAGLIFTENF